MPEEPYYDAKLPPPDIKQDEKHKEQYPTEDFINDLASFKVVFEQVYSVIRNIQTVLFETFA